MCEYNNILMKNGMVPGRHYPTNDSTVCNNQWKLYNVEPNNRNKYSKRLAKADLTYRKAIKYEA